MNRSYCDEKSLPCRKCGKRKGENLDCVGNPIRGGKREGAGAPDLGRKRHGFYTTDAEASRIKEFIKSLRDTIKQPP